MTKGTGVHVDCQRVHSAVQKWLRQPLPENIMISIDKAHRPDSRFRTANPRRRASGELRFPSLAAPAMTIPVDAAGPPRFRHDPLHVMWPRPGGAMAPRDRGTTHVAFGSHDGLGLHNVVISWLNPTPHAITVYAWTPRCRDARNTRYRAARYALPGRDFTRWIAPASPGAPCGDPTHAVGLTSCGRDYGRRPPKKQSSTTPKMA